MSAQWGCTLPLPVATLLQLALRQLACWHEVKVNVHSWKPAASALEHSGAFMQLGLSLGKTMAIFGSSSKRHGPHTIRQAASRIDLLILCPLLAGEFGSSRHLEPNGGHIGGPLDVY